MVKLSEEFILKLKAACDIVSVVSSYVELKSSGRIKKCCCPFHSEKTPSFVVFEETQSFYCFGCGTGGDVITFVEKIENLQYIEAVKLLCKHSGLTMPVDEKEDELYKIKLRMLKMNRLAAKFYFNNLKKENGLRAIRYLTANRKLKKETIVKFGIGVALKEWSSLRDYLKSNGFSYDEMTACGLVIENKKGKYYDRFRDRIIFPIIDLKGDVVAFGGRSLNEESGPKYLNSSDCLVFKKGCCLFGLNFAKNSKFKSFILCEGYLDAIMLHQNGFDNAVATLGTSLTKEQVRLLNRNSKEVILAYDSDEAGKMATNRASNLFEEVGIKIKVLRFSGAKDPDEYIKKFGTGYFKNVVENAVELERLKFNELLEKYDITNLEERKIYINEFCKIVSQIKDPLKKEIYIGDVCARLDLDKYVVKNHINFLVKNIKRNFDKNVYKNLKLTNKKYSGNGEKIPLKVIKAQEGIVRFLYFNPDFAKYVKQRIFSENFYINWHKKVFDFLLSLIEVKKNLDVSIFHEILDEDEMSEFVKIINSKEVFSNTQQELEDYIKTIKDHFESRKENVPLMSLQELEIKRKMKANLKR